MEKSTLTFKNGIKDGLPIGLGYLPVSFAFGVQASLAGVPALITIFISMTNLTSAGQLAGLGIISALGSFLELAIIQAVINSRYFIMSVALTQKTDETFTLGKSLFCAAFVTDEVFAVAASKPQSVNVKYFKGLALLPYIGWVTGTVLGALSGNVLPQNAVAALGLALYAMFIAIIVPPSLSLKGVLPTVLLSAGFSCLLYYLPLFGFLSDGTAIVISALSAALIIAAIFPVKEADDAERA